MKKQLLLVGLLSTLILPTAFGQTSQGFSSQTQPVITFQTSYLRETLRDSLIHGKLPVLEKEKTPLTKIAAPVVLQATDDNTKEVTVPVGQVDIADDRRILEAYDLKASEWESNKSLAWWLTQFIADGDFSKISAGSAPKAGTFGVDAVRMKALYRSYTYTGVDESSSKTLPELTGTRGVYVPTFTFTMLFTLFGQGNAMSTGIKAGAAKSARASRDVTRGFGQTLLVPGALVQNGNSGVISTTWSPFPTSEKGLNQFTVDATILYAHTDWTTRDSSTAVNILAPSIGIGYRVFGRYLTSVSSQTQVRLFARYALRHLYGDIESQPRLLQDVFDSTKRTYHGFEVGATASAGAVRVTVSGGLFNGDIEGFSHGQTVYGLGLAAGIRLP
jgi:hypothetical protein